MSDKQAGTREVKLLAAARASKSVTIRAFLIIEYLTEIFEI
jgi:hypothetical protein